MRSGKSDQRMPKPNRRRTRRGSASSRRGIRALLRNRRRKFGVIATLITVESSRRLVLNILIGERWDRYPLSIDSPRILSMRSR
jgi:hypothetical protein